MSTSIQPKDANATTATPRKSAPAVTPRYTIAEAHDAYTVRVEIPGVSKEQVQMHTEPGVLHLEAETVATYPESAQVIHRESRDRTYRLALRLGNSVQSDKISAKLENGVLEIRLAKQEQAQTRQISVE